MKRSDIKSLPSLHLEIQDSPHAPVSPEFEIENPGRNRKELLRLRSFWESANKTGKLARKTPPSIIEVPMTHDAPPNFRLFMGDVRIKGNNFGGNQFGIFALTGAGLKKSGDRAHLVELVVQNQSSNTLGLATLMSAGESSPPTFNEDNTLESFTFGGDKEAIAVPAFMVASAIEFLKESVLTEEC